MIVSEVFGPTVQGEGPSTGRRCGFLRLGRCNLDCAWCDTPYTWDWTGKNGTVYDPAVELSRVNLTDVADQVLAMGVGLLVVTGGEPMVQQRSVAELCHMLDGVDVEVETNGTIIPQAYTTEQVTRFNVSPKLANSGIAVDRRIIPEAITALNDTGQAAFKFVARDDRCMDEIDGLVTDLGLDPGDVWVMPEGRNTTDLTAHMEAVADRAVGSGYNLSGRLHVTVWGDRRGV
jgi:7-carboxy-7-deazaguanine synthase